ncbi:MAG TPA: DUF4157 domain-containing protein [Allosphingosinicella sp.]|nr:DUF4157 domain-containing protein [Allosphingosinicella sp.]
MAESSRRALTEGEVALARKAFGDRIDYDRVRICHGAGGNPAAALAFLSDRNDAITLVRTIFCKGEPVADYSSHAHKSLFIHEMTHVWQYQTLGVARFYLRYGREFVACRFDAKAMYRYEKGDPFDKAKLEAQAEMVRDYGRDSAGMAKAAPSLAGTGLYGL